MSPVEAVAARVLAERGVGGHRLAVHDDSCAICEYVRHSIAAEIAAALRADEGLVEEAARACWDWIYDDDDACATVYETEMPAVARAALDAITGSES